MRWAFSTERRSLWICEKECKNLNSLAQHECRCPQNPNRKAFDHLLKNIANESAEARKKRCGKSSQTLRDKYASGHINPRRGTHVNRSYLYKEHNDQEIARWLAHIKTLNIKIPNYETFLHPEGYKVISKGQVKIDKSVRLNFEHIYLGNLLLEGKLIKVNTVHHIDSIRDNNTLTNLMVFIDSNNHKRFHNSDYAWLIYDPITHLFSCELRK